MTAPYKRPTPATLQDVSGAASFALVSERPLTVGRTDSVDLRIRDNSISRVHAILVWDGRGWSVVDLSSNGTYVNGRAIHRQQLHEGDVLRFADCSEWVFSCDHDEQVDTESEMTARPTLSGEYAYAAIEESIPVNQRAIIGTCPSTSALRSEIPKLARTSSTVLILGEFGTGKRHVARALHLSGPRRERPLIRIDCGKITPEDVTSCLSLAGMSSDCWPARPGTVLLENVSALSLESQSAFVEILEEHAQHASLDGQTRFVSITRTRLHPLVEQECFLQELLVRLGVIQISLESLVDRLGDIPELATHFARRFAAAYNKTIDRISPEAATSLENYDWPGNVAELKNVIQRAVMLCSTSELASFDLTKGIGASLESPAFAGFSLQDLECVHIQATLEELNWKKSRAAEILGIERSTLDRKIKRYNIERSQSEKSRNHDIS